MKPSQDRLPEAGRQRAVALVEARIDGLFQRLPMLCGFLVREDLYVSDVAINTWPGYTAGADLYEEIADTIAVLLDERPETKDLLRARTFARTLQ
ncbi:MAG TPA: hypothetical protein VET51_04280 [Burkholderiales bacterium]|nr:hypothetical protein [Burkholderiales bacterium]